MPQTRSELLDNAVSRLAGLEAEDQDRIAIEILADLCSEEEWVLIVASEPYQKWLSAQSKRMSGNAAVTGE